MLTRRICLGLQRKDARMLEHGVETGIIRQLPTGEFVEEERPLTAQERAVLFRPLHTTRPARRGSLP